MLIISLFILFVFTNDNNIEHNKENKLINDNQPKKNYFIKKIKNIAEIETTNLKSIFKVLKINQENKKEFYVEAKEVKDLYLGKVYVVYRYTKEGFYNELAKAFYVDEITINNTKYFKFRIFTSKGTLNTGDELSFLGKPTAKDALNKLNHALMDYSNISRELGDLHFGSMSFSFSYGVSSLKSKSSGPSVLGDNNTFQDADGNYILSEDINKYKNYPWYNTYNLSYRWWFFFFSSMGLDVNYFFTNSIPTEIYNREKEINEIRSSSFNGYSASILFRRRFFRMPAIFGLKYFSDTFTTDNKDDTLMSSTYSGVNINASFNFPYKFTILPLSFFNMVFHNLELGIGLSPIVFVNDSIYSRGNRPSLISYRFHSGILFNFESKYLDFLKDIFFGLKYEYVTYDLKFLGPTSPLNSLPENTNSKEMYSYIGLQIKYEFKDFFGD